MRLIWLVASLLILATFHDGIFVRGKQKRQRRQAACSTALASALNPFYRYDLPSTNPLIPGLHDKYDTALGLSAVPLGYNYDTTHGCVLTTNDDCDCSLVQLHVYYKYDTFWNTKNYITTMTTDPLSWNYTEDANQSLWCVSASSTIGTCGATILLQRYYNMIDVDHTLGAQLDTTLTAKGYTTDFLIPNAVYQCYVWDISMCSTTATTSTTSDCTTNLTAFYRYDLPTTDASALGLHDKYDTALSLSEVPAGYNYDTVHGCVLTSNVGCSCTLVQLHVYYKYDTFWKVKNYITTIGTDPLTWGYTEDTTQSLWCVPATSTSGTCGATVLIQRYYNMLDLDHALGVQLDTTLTLKGYGLDFPFMGGSQCYVWDLSTCTVTSPSPSPSPVSTGTATSTTTDCTTYLTAFYRYNLPTTDALTPGLHDKYDTALSLSEVPAGYNYDTVHGCILTNNAGCSCTLTQLHVFYKYDTFWKVKNYITTIGTDPLTWGYTEDTTQSLWCVPATSTSGTCGATVLIQRYYNLLDLDHALGVQLDTTLTLKGYGLDLPFMGGDQCYVWDLSMCSTAATTSVTSDCTSYLTAFYRYDLPTTGARGLHDKYDTALSLSEVPSGYAYDTVHGCVLKNNVGCSCTLTQLHVFYKYDTFWNVKNYITTIGTDPLTWGYMEDTTQNLWCVPATSTSGTCGATVLLQRYYNLLDTDHALGVQLDTTLTLNGYGLDLPFMGGSQCYVWDISMCSTVATTSTSSDCTSHLSAFYRYDLPTTNLLLPGLHDKYDTVLGLTAIPSGYNYDTVHGCVLTTNVGCNCALVQLHVYYIDTNPNVKNYITSVTTDPLTWGYKEDTSQTMWCVPASSPSGTCQATILLQRYHNLMDTDHALGVQLDPELTLANGYTTDFMVPTAVDQCYVWDSSFCDVTSPSPTASTSATVTSVNECTAYLSPFYRYDSPTPNPSEPGLHDKYDTTLSLVEIPSDYSYDTIHGCVLTNNECSCPLVQLHVYFMNDTINNIRNHLTTIRTDPLMYNFVEDTTQSLWCVPVTSPSGTCGATRLLQRYYNQYDVDHALGVQDDPTLTSNSYVVDWYGGIDQCYIWDSSQCSVTTYSPSPSSTTINTATTTFSASSCTTYLSAFYRYDLPSTSSLMPGLHDKYDTTQSLAVVPLGYNYDTTHGCVLTKNDGCNCSLVQLHTYYKYDTLFNVKNHITTITTDPLNWGYTEDTTESLWCVPATSTSGTCGATVLLQRYYNAIDIDHALGVQSDTTLSGYSIDMLGGVNQCYIWDTSMCQTTCSVHTGLRLDLIRYENSAWGLLKDSYISTIAPDSSYTAKINLGQIAADNEGCPEAVKLNFYVKNDVLLGIITMLTDHFATIDPIPLGYTLDSMNSNLYCVPVNAANKCGAIVPLYRFFSLLNWDHSYSTASTDVAGLKANGYITEYNDLPECYIWASNTPYTCSYWHNYDNDYHSHFHNHEYGYYSYWHNTHSNCNSHRYDYYNHFLNHGYNYHSHRYNDDSNCNSYWHNNRHDYYTHGYNPYSNCHSYWHNYRYDYYNHFLNHGYDYHSHSYQYNYRHNYYSHWHYNDFNCHSHKHNYGYNYYNTGNNYHNTGYDYYNSGYDYHNYGYDHDNTGYDKHNYGNDYHNTGYHKYNYGYDYHNYGYDHNNTGFDYYNPGYDYNNTGYDYHNDSYDKHNHRNNYNYHYGLSFASISNCAMRSSSGSDRDQFATITVIPGIAGRQEQRQNG
uniref:Uncharacterized protein n=1 Tax=Plectus sambesii TaxID=2011161 RepID=A0A914XPS4_9BILA